MDANIVPMMLRVTDSDDQSGAAFCEGVEGFQDNIQDLVLNSYFPLSRVSASTIQLVAL